MSALAYGTLAAAAQYGLETLSVRPRRGYGGITAQATVEESHQDDLEITEHPVELGAPIADHAFKRPPQVVITAVWSNSPAERSALGGLASAVTSTIAGVQSLANGSAPSQARDAYEKLLALQESRELVDVYTGKRLYRNMLLQGVQTTTSKETENSLVVRLTFRHVIVVATRLVDTSSVPASAQAEAAVTQSPAARGNVALTPSTFTP